MQIIGRINQELYSCVVQNILNDEVVITEERIQHIMARHPGDWEQFAEYIAQTIEEPDYIIAANKASTAVVLKEFADREKKFKLILRLKVAGDPEGYRNSIISFWRIGDVTWNKLIKNKKILYKKV